MKTVQNLVTGSISDHEKRNSWSSGSLVAPPTSESPHTPSLTPPNIAAVEVVPEVSISFAYSQRTSPENSNLCVGDDSGFISGFSSPANILNASKVSSCY